ncbi:Pentatricopeptide repeat superfamily protein [Prunus dulcis]|uniref:Pentatricopeptide repeat superfamily protein n=1 Tax=Prunus dulcis TaxID=3755 RepID=A0A4Y1QNW4_PRUDU|nr:Pentatricopeptide repeat superfamily protein [Prunus dulcis]
MESEVSDVLDWGLPDTSSSIHPIYFAKCLTKVINIKYHKKMDHPSNGVSILGCLRPAFADEEFYIAMDTTRTGKSTISLEDFQDAEPDVLVNATSEIVDRFNERGIRCDVALKALCKRKGLHVEGAHLIGVDSLGMDVRVFSGLEVQTHRFPFKVRATSEVAAEKQIQQLLFPRSRRKKLKNWGC